MEETLKRTVIRTMTEQDIFGVLAIERLSFATPWSEEALRLELTRGGTRSGLLVAEREEGVRGFIIYWVVADSAEILEVAVAPAARREGLGSRLLRTAILDMERRGARNVHLELRPTNAAALALYTKYGFERAYVRPRYYDRPQEDAWVLRLDLGQ